MSEPTPVTDDQVNHNHGGAPASATPSAQESAANRLQRLPEDEVRKARLDSLSHRMKSFNPTKSREKNGGNSASNKDMSGMAVAFRLSSEFIAGIGVGAGLGYGLDLFLGSSPWGLIIFLLLGFVAGVMNVLRSAGLVTLKKPDSSKELGKND